VTGGFYIRATSPTMNVPIYRNATPSSCSFSNVSVKEVTLDRAGDPIQLINVPSNVPRIDYDPVTGVCKGLLIEEQRTNLLSFSSDFSNAWWAKLNCSVIAGPAAPNGLSSNTIVPDATDGYHRVAGAGVSVNAASAHTGFVIAKAAGYGGLQLTEICSLNLKRADRRTTNQRHKIELPYGGLRNDK